MGGVKGHKTGHSLLLFDIRLATEGQIPKTKCSFELWAKSNP
jgi:hypothetical protein